MKHITAATTLSILLSLATPVFGEELPAYFQEDAGVVDGQQKKISTIRECCQVPQCAEMQIEWMKRYINELLEDYKYERESLRITRID